MKINVKITDKGVGRTARELFGKRQASVTVGVFGDKGANPVPDSPLTVADLAAIHEFGLGVPERSFIRSYLDGNEPRIMRAFLNQMKNEMLRAVRTGRSVSDADKKRILDRMGLMMQGDIQARIGNGDITPALDQKTIDRKGSSTPLIDTGQLRSSISFESELK